MKIRAVTAQFVLSLIMSFFLIGSSYAAAKDPVKNTDNFVLQDFSGNKHKLEDHTGKGKWLIVMIWAHDCHFCNAEVANYIQFHEKHKNNDATVLGISVDGWDAKDKAQEFITRHNVSFPNLIATRESVEQMYFQKTKVKMGGTPSFLIYSPAGELKAEQAGAVPTTLIEDFIAKNN